MFVRITFLCVSKMQDAVFCLNTFEGMIKAAEYHLQCQMTLVCDRHKKQLSVRRGCQRGHITVTGVHPVLCPAVLEHITLSRRPLVTTTAAPRRLCPPGQNTKQIKLERKSFWLKPSQYVHAPDSWKELFYISVLVV